MVLNFSIICFRKPPKPPKKTQFASSFDELKQVHRGTRTNSSRNGTSEGRRQAQPWEQGIRAERLNGQETLGTGEEFKHRETGRDSDQFLKSTCSTGYKRRGGESSGTKPGERKSQDMVPGGGGSEVGLQVNESKLVGKGKWLWSPTKFFVPCFCSLFWPCTKHNRFNWRFWVVSE